MRVRHTHGFKTHRRGLSVSGDAQDRPDSQSTLISRNITVRGRRTSVRLEPEMWMALREIARREKCKIHDLCTLIHMRKNQDSSLTAAIRVFLMLYYRAAATEDGHARAGHGSFDNMIRRARMAEDYARVQAERTHKDPQSYARQGMGAAG